MLRTATVIVLATPLPYRALPLVRAVAAAESATP